MKTWIHRGLIFACILAYTLSAWADPARDTLRIYQISRDTFDYAFTSYKQVSGKKPVVSIRRRDGKIFSVHVGEKIDQYKVVSFVPGQDSSANVQTGRITLVDRRRTVVTLELGKLRRLPGWYATLVSTKTGERWTVRNSDTVLDGRVVIDVVAENAVVASFSDGSNRIPVISDVERKELARRWKQKREQRQQVAATQQQAVIVNNEREMVHIQAGNMGGGRVTATPGTQPEFFFGTEYVYPSEYEVWVVRQGKEGDVRPMVVPKKFESRKIGWSYGSDGFSHTGVADYSRYSHPSHVRHKTYTPHPSSTMVPFPSPNFTRFEYRRKPAK